MPTAVPLPQGRRWSEMAAWIAIMRRRPRRPQPATPIITETVRTAKRARATTRRPHRQAWERAQWYPTRFLRPSYAGPPGHRRRCTAPLEPGQRGLGPVARSPRQAAGRSDDRGGPACRPRLGGRRPCMAGGGGKRRPAGGRHGLGIRRGGHGSRQVAPTARPGVLWERAWGSSWGRRWKWSRCRNPGGPGRGGDGRSSTPPTHLCRGTTRWPARSGRGAARCSRVGGPTVVDDGGGERTVDDALGRPVVRYVGQQPVAAGGGATPG